MVSDKVKRHRGNGEELESEVFDGCFRFSICQKVGVNDSTVNVCKVRRYELIVSLDDDYHSK